MTADPEAGSPAPVVRARHVAGAPVVAVRVWLAGGRRAEEIPGLGLVSGRLLAEGSRRRDWRRIAEEAEARGAVVESAGSAEGIEVAVDALADDWERAIDWAAELALEPVFPDDRLRWVARQAAAELEAAADDAELRTARAFLDQLYHPHPRSRPLQGDRESLARLTPPDCARFHQASAARAMVVAITGAVEEDAALRRAADRFGLRSGPMAPAVTPAAARGRGPRVEVALPRGEQAHLFLGHLTVAAADPEWFPLRLLGVVLGAGAGLSGRIPQRVREREGLAYAAHADATVGAGLDPGRFEVYLGTAPEQIERALAAVREELDRLLLEGVEDAELEAARAFVLGRLPFQRETAGQWAEILVQSAIHGLPWERSEWIEERFRAVDREQLLRTARRRLLPGELRVTVGLPV